MGSSKWSYKSPSTGYTYIVTLLTTLVITISEPPSTPKTFLTTNYQKPIT